MWGEAVLSEIEKFAIEREYKIVAALKYSHKAADLTSETRKLIASRASCYLFASYLSDAILFMKTLKYMGATPRLIWGQGSGLISPDFYKTLGADVNGILARELFSPELIKVNPVTAQLNALYKKRKGYDLSGISAREFVGVQVWAHALNNAGSTAPEAIRKALNALYILPKELIMPWRGVRFGSPFRGDTQQNELASGIINQYRGFPEGKLEMVFPFRFATADLIFPFPGWK
jgi:branched-chain amino acid transport system substrate-binding protein